MPKGSLGYYLEVIFYEVVYKNVIFMDKNWFPWRGQKIFFEKSARRAQTRLYHAENASTLIRWKLPEEIGASKLTNVVEKSCTIFCVGQWQWTFMYEKISSFQRKLIRISGMHEYSSGRANTSSKSSTHCFPCDGGSIRFLKFELPEKAFFFG